MVIVLILAVASRMSKVCDEWSLEDLLEMEEEDMDALLRFYEPGTVPTFEEIRLRDRQEEFAFDGSFGWW